jgi:hypothetical protein
MTETEKVLTGSNCISRQNKICAASFRQRADTSTKSSYGAKGKKEVTVPSDWVRFVSCFKWLMKQEVSKMLILTNGIWGHFVNLPFFYTPFKDHFILEFGSLYS